MDGGALTGLRGIFAIHILLFHALHDMPLPLSARIKIDMYGELSMPIFYLLSGFSLAIGYGNTKWCLFNQIQNLPNTLNDKNSKEAEKTFDMYGFYRKRCIRILPLHFYGIILSLVVWYFRYDMSTCCSNEISMA